MESATHRRLIWICVAVSLLLALAKGAVWEYQHDEGTTFDLAIGLIDEGHFVPSGNANPAPVSALYRTIEGRTDYGIADVVDALTPADGYRLYHPPAYYVLLHVWSKIFGTSRLVLRLPAYLLMALSLLGMARIARRVIPERGAGVWIALLFGVSPWVLRITNFLRPYHLALFCAVWATVAVLALMRQRPHRGWDVLFVLLSLLGIYSLYHYGIVLLWHLALLAWHGWSAGPGRRRRELSTLGLLSAALLLGYAPWLHNFLVHLKVSGNSHDYFAGTVVAEHWSTQGLQALLDFALGDAVMTLGSRVLVPITLLLTAITVPLAVWAFVGPPRRALGTLARRFWISVLLMPLLILVSDIWRGSHTLFITKLCFGLSVPLALIVVRSWLTLPVAWLRHAGLACWALLLLAAISLNCYTRAAHLSTMENAAEAIAQADSGYHLVVLSNDLRGYSVPFLLSLREAGVRNVFVAQASGHAQLTKLLVKLSNDWGFRFQRVSLVNFNTPSHPEEWTWRQMFLKDYVVAMARKSRRWQVFWHNRQPWMGKQVVVTRDRPPDVTRELWLIGPVHTSFFSHPVLTEEKLLRQQALLQRRGLAGMDDDTDGVVSPGDGESDAGDDLPEGG